MKKFGFVLVALLLFALVIGCAKAAPTTPTTPATPAAPATTAAPAKPAPATTAPAPSAPATAAPTPAAPEAQKYGGVLKILTTGMPILGTPWEGGNLWARAGRAAYEMLLACDEQEHLHPWLAESWKVAPDGKSVTFNLRKGVKFQDGTDFNAEAVKYNLDSWPPGSTGRVALANVTSVDVVDQYTVRLNLKQYDAFLMMELATGDLAMVSPTAAKKATTPDKRVYDHMVGTGPFKIVDYKMDAYAKFQKWDGYWQKGRPYLDGVEFVAIADTTTRIMAFKAGDGQFVEPLQPIERNSLEKDGYPTTEGTMGFVSFICTDGGNPKSPFADIRVRQAVEYSIDKEGLYNGLFLKRWPPAYQQALRNDPYYNPDIQPRKYDPAKAKQLLADAGYPKGFKVVLHGETRGSKDQQEAIRTFLTAVGMDCTLDIADPGRFTTLINNGWEGLMMPGFPNPSSTKWVAQRFGSPAYYVNKPAPAGYFQQWDTVATQIDENIRVDQVKKLLQIMANEVITIPIYETHPQSASNGKVNGLDWCGKKNTNYWNPTEVWLSK